MISDFLVIGDQDQLLELVVSVPTAWRTLAEIADGGERALGRISAAANATRRRASSPSRSAPGICIADKVLDGVTGIRLGASMVACPQTRREPSQNFKWFGVRRPAPPDASVRLRSCPWFPDTSSSTGGTP